MFSLAFLSRVELHADTPGELVLLFTPTKDFEAKPDAVFAGLDLRGSELQGVDLSRADFSDCVMRRVRIRGCNLAEASFQRAELHSAIIDECGLSGANFTDAKINGLLMRSPGNHELCDFHLSEVQLKSTMSYKQRDLAYCIVSGRIPEQGERPKYDFRNASLHNAALVAGDFSDCDFLNADINFSIFKMCRAHFSSISKSAPFASKVMIGTQLSECRVYGNCDFSGMRLANVSFSAEFCDSLRMEDTIIEACYLRGIDAAQLEATKSYQLSKLAGITFDRCDLSGCNFTGANLAGTTFSRTNLDGVSLDDAVVSGAQFAHVRGGLAPAQIRSTWNYKHNHMEGITLPRDVADGLGLSLPKTPIQETEQARRSRLQGSGQESVAN